MPASTIFVPSLKPESAVMKGRNKNPAAQGCAETEAAKFSLKEEATALQAPPVRNGGCYKQPFVKRPISCLHAAVRTERAGMCLLGHSCSRKNRQSIMCACTARHLLGTLQQNVWRGLVPSAGSVQRHRTIIPADTRLGKWYTPSAFSREQGKQGKLSSAATQ